MQEIFIGELIRQRRMDLGLTQEQLCEGICEPMTISRLENGRQTPSRNRINALLERLGLPGDRYYALVSKQEEELERLRADANARYIRAESSKAEERTEALKEAWAALARLEQTAEPDDRQTQQFVLQIKSALGSLEGRYDEATRDYPENCVNLR